MLPTAHLHLAHRHTVVRYGLGTGSSHPEAGVNAQSAQSVRADDKPLIRPRAGRCLVRRKAPLVIPSGEELRFLRLIKLLELRPGY